MTNFTVAIGKNCRHLIFRTISSHFTNHLFSPLLLLQKLLPLPHHRKFENIFGLDATSYLSFLFQRLKEEREFQIGQSSTGQSRDGLNLLFARICFQGLALNWFYTGGRVVFQLKFNQTSNLFSSSELSKTQQNSEEITHLKVKLSISQWYLAMLWQSYSAVLSSAQQCLSSSAQ